MTIDIFAKIRRAASIVDTAVMQASLYGFTPAFHDTRSGSIVFSKSSSGHPASIHQPSSVPADWVGQRTLTGRVRKLKPAVVTGYVRDGYFFTREKAAAAIEQERSYRYAGSAYYDCF